MLDGLARKLLTPLFDRAGRRVARTGITADQVTVSAFLVGLAGAAAIATGHFLAGLVLIAASRIGDGLDGAVAKATRRTDFGGYLDIVLDFVFYGAVPLGLRPRRSGRQRTRRRRAALLVLCQRRELSRLCLARRAPRHEERCKRGAKSIYFTTGLAEATETYRRLRRLLPVSGCTSR